MAVETDTLREILAMGEDEKYVTWKQLISTVLVALSLGMGLAGWAWSVHVAQPHSDALSQDEYSRDSQQIEARLQRMENKIDVLLQRPKK